MNALLQDIKDHSLDIYQKHFKSHVDKSIDKIEQTGPGKFVLDSLRSLTIWTITCLVYLYTKFEIAYEKYRLSDDKSSDVKIYKVWCGGNTPKLYERFSTFAAVGAFLLSELVLDFSIVVYYSKM